MTAMKREEELTVSVKPLEWACSPEWKPGEFVQERFVFSVAGHYRIWHDDTVTPNVWHVSYPVGSKQPYEGTEHANIEAAKAAAQADYEARIRSALLPTEGVDHQVHHSKPVISQNTKIVEGNATEGGAHEKAEAFDRIFAAYRKYVDAVSTYNARRELASAERMRGNWAIKLDEEYHAMADAQSDYHRTVQNECRAALAAKQTDGREE